MKRALATLLAVVIGAAVLACSPEATRLRNGGPGADVGNHSPSAPSPSTPPPVPGG